VTTLGGVCLHLGDVLVELYSLIGVEDSAKGRDALISPLLQLRTTRAHTGRIAGLALRPCLVVPAVALRAFGVHLLASAIAEVLELGLLVRGESDAAE
jgi:hypothetical protein